MDRGAGTGPASRPERTPRHYSDDGGTATVDGSPATTSGDAQCEPVLFAAPQVRKVRFVGERVILTPPPAKVEGVEVTRELTWQRISTQSL